ncbi:hypothetical protein AJ80_07762 [Polytolypa hystricis UAMH7299]|uniref:tRNA-splicing endonuclease subunit Sen15 domain-containing protein n=1 Tax=Polytolypa hystricis (strain UAMH7299) TaxID=1447883 RepID=A0A2B7XIP5_POLH7|nr:hypothetical protein AJ80_07762 [Polytolypa hystricis UAMH7299]
MSTTTLPAPPSPSAVTSLITTSTSSASPDPVSALTLEVHHNLQHQHLWTSLIIHDVYTLSPTQSTPLISGQPPQAVYIHPDEQAYLLEQGISADDIPVDREWVIPTAQGQSWTLRRLAGIFDSLPAETSGRDAAEEEHAGEDMSEKLAAHAEKKKEEDLWGGKRALIAMVNRKMGGDGTVVYYVVLEGAVKPRQN